MLQTMHNKAAGFFVKILMGLLVASFAFWGVGDIFRGGASNTVITVGDGVVSAQEFRMALDQETAEYRRMLGNQYSPELLKNLGVPAQVLDKLVQQHLVEEEVKAQGIVTPESYLMTEMRNNPAFQGADGKFDAGRFNMVLANNNLTEPLYLSLLSKEAGADMLLQSMFSGLQATDVAATLAYRYENEKRTADLLVFKPELVSNIPEPTNVDLQRFYEENADKFRAQEYRVISLVSLDTAAMLEDMEVSEDDLLIEYQNRIDDFRVPEKREVKQLLFADEATAAKAAEALGKGMSLESAAKEFGATNNALLLGTVTASGVLPEAEQAVFSLKKGAHTAPIQSSFGWHVFQVSRIEPEHTRPLSEVKEQLAQDIRAQRVGNEAYELSNTLQDDLAGGATLEEAAKSVDAELRSFGPVDAEGNAPDGTQVRLPDGYPNLLADAFHLPANENSNLMETEDGSYYALRVDSIQPERNRALDEVKGIVIEEWKERRKGEELYKLASGVSANLASEDVQQVAAQTRAELLKGQSFTRASSRIGEKEALPSMMLTAIFSAEKGTATEVFALADGSYVVAKVTGIERAGTESPESRAGIEKARNDLRAVYADELYLRYMAYLRDKHGVSEPDQATIDILTQ